MATVKAVLNKTNEETGDKTSREIEVDFDFGADLDEMVNEFSRDVVYQQAKSAITVSLQTALRSWMDSGASDEEVGKKLAEWTVPSGRTRSANRLEKVGKIVEKMSQEEREALLAQLAE